VEVIILALIAGRFLLNLNVIMLRDVAGGSARILLVVEIIGLVLLVRGRRGEREIIVHGILIIVIVMRQVVGIMPVQMRVGVKQIVLLEQR